MRYLRIMVCVGGLAAIMMGLFGDLLWFGGTPALAQPSRPTLTPKPQADHDDDDDDDRDSPTATPTATPESPTATSEPPTATPEPPTMTAEPPTATPAMIPRQLPRTGKSDAVQPFWVIVGLIMVILGASIRATPRSGRE